MADRHELALEQAHVDRAYDRLEQRRRIATGEPPPPLNDSAGAALERDELAAIRTRRLEALKLGDLPLCFGRIDVDADGPEAWHIGRLAVDNEAGDPLIVDWRAPIAEPFYRAVRSDPMGVVRRRHLRCRAWTVLELDDELFGENRLGAADDNDDDVVVVGEAALLRAIRRKRTGRMGDIVATIQRAQDEIIRAPLEQTLVVQGGPGTGKTAVALHRIAYLLYTHREALQTKGVLVVGPNPTFLRYIERVLPSLGEQGTTLTTAVALRGGEPPARVEPHESARVKGDVRMVDVVARAVASRERPLKKQATVPFGAYRLGFGVSASKQIIERTQTMPGSHNHRRAAAERLVMAHLHRLYLRAVERARLTGKNPAGALDRRDFTESALALPATKRLLDRLWPVLTPEQLLRDLLAHRALLREATAGILSDAEQEAILARQEGPEEWTDADVALLDEASVHLGTPPRRQSQRAPREDLDWMADRVLDGVAADEDIALSASIAADIRERIVNDQVGQVEQLPTRVRTTYGHVVVDEAQDLSPMQWRMIARRCPSGSMTLVGDLDQASGGWQLTWEQVLEVAAPEASAGHRVAELAVNYRTPAEVMGIAGRVLAAARPERRAPSSVRESGHAPAIEAVEDEAVAASAASAAEALLHDIDGGTVAVIAEEPLHPALRSALDATEGTRRRAIETIDDPVALLTPARSKGLEFDGVVVVEPGQIVDSSPAGAFALYIALTRTTDRLHVVHAGALPDAFAAVARVVG